MSYTAFDYRVEDGVATVTFTRPDALPLSKFTTDTVHVLPRVNRAGVTSNSTRSGLAPSRRA